VDFLAEGNEDEIISIIDQVYTDPATRELAKSDVEDDNVAVYGKRVLTMAKQEGKGWFAIMLGKHISFQTEIPEYIVDAILFAKETYSKNIIADIIEYRINKHFDDNDTLDFSSCRENLTKYRSEGATLDDLAFDLDLIISDDQLLIFIDKLK
jgi:hypothetical protein